MNYFDYTESDEVYDGGLLPEVTLTPTAKDKAILKEILEKVPNAEDRQKLLDLINFHYNNNPIETADGFNDMASRAATVYELSGSPSIHYKPLFFMKNILKPLGLDFNMGTSRAYHNPVTNSIHNIHGVNPLVAELSHGYLNNNDDVPRGFTGPTALLDSWMNKKNSVYRRPGTLEYETHRIIEPVLNEYILKGKGGWVNLDETLRIGSGPAELGDNEYLLNKIKQRHKNFVTEEDTYYLDQLKQSLESITSKK